MPPWLRSRAPWACCSLPPLSTLTYRPYWYIFHHAIVSGDRGQTRDLRNFLAALQTVPRALDLSVYLPVYFWTAVTLFGIIGLILILLRHLLGHARADQLQHSPRVT